MNRYNTITRVYMTGTGTLWYCGLFLVIQSEPVAGPYFQGIIAGLLVALKQQMPEADVSIRCVPPSCPPREREVVCGTRDGR